MTTEPWGAVVTTEQDVLHRIRNLVDEERELRSRPDHAEHRDRLQNLEVQLDQCWDLLRQRRALQEAGRDPEGARVRPTGEVEGYLG